MPWDDVPSASRRRLLVSAGGLAAAMGTGLAARAAAPDGMSAPRGAAEPFWGPHQAGIVTPAQDHLYFATFDLVTGKRDEVAALLGRWTAAAAALSMGRTVTVPPMAAPAPASAAATAYAPVAQPADPGSYAPAAAGTGRDATPPSTGRDATPPGTGRDATPSGTGRDARPPDIGPDAAPPGTARYAAPPGAGTDGGTAASGYGGDAGSEQPDPGHDSLEALGLGPSRLTLTFGFGPGLFLRDGKDRYGLAALRPAALADLPRFNGDQLQPARTGGDLSVQACADDPQVAFHAVRELARLAYGVAQLRWAQTGFIARPGTGGTPRNLLGFKDGTQTPEQIEHVVWAGDEAPAWMRGGSYLVVRRIRMALEHWDRTNVSFQEQTIGREKLSGAPLGLKDEFAPLGLDRADRDGNPIIPDTAHVRLANAGTNGGAEILRRGYSYNDGADFTAERWPPWRQGIEYDAGLFFVCYQRDPRTGFIRIFENMAKLDMLNQFVTHTGGGLFACPGGAREGEFIGQRLFESA